MASDRDSDRDPGRGRGGAGALAEIVEFRMDDVVRLRKPHPCGSFEWRIVRIGADIGLRCLGCQRRVGDLRFAGAPELRDQGAVAHHEHAIPHERDLLEIG